MNIATSVNGELLGRVSIQLKHDGHYECHDSSTTILHTKYDTFGELVHHLETKGNFVVRHDGKRFNLYIRTAAIYSESEGVLLLDSSYLASERVKLSNQQRKTIYDAFFISINQLLASRGIELAETYKTTKLQQAITTKKAY